MCTVLQEDDKLFRKNHRPERDNDNYLNDVQLKPGEFLFGFNTKKSFAWFCTLKYEESEVPSMRYFIEKFESLQKENDFDHSYINLLKL